MEKFLVSIGIGSTFGVWQESLSAGLFAFLVSMVMVTAIEEHLRK